MSLIVSLLAAVASAAQPLAPSGTWNVEYADSACVLQRSFGDGHSRATIKLRAPLTGTTYNLALLTKDAQEGARKGKARLWLSQGAKPLEIAYVSEPLVGSDSRETSLFLDWREVSAMSSSRMVVIEAGRDHRLAFSPDQIGPGLETLNKCRDDLLQAHGVDLNALVAIERRAEAFDRKAILIRPHDYPQSAFDAGLQGSTTILWKIDVDGMVRDCSIVRTSGHGVLDDAACNVVKTRGRYRPALDKAGKPMISWDSMRVVWWISDH